MYDNEPFGNKPLENEPFGKVPKDYGFPKQELLERFPNKNYDKEK